MDKTIHIHNKISRNPRKEDGFSHNQVSEYKLNPKGGAKLGGPTRAKHSNNNQINKIPDTTRTNCVTFKLIVNQLQQRESHAYPHVIVEIYIDIEITNYLRNIVYIQYFFIGNIFFSF